MEDQLSNFQQTILFIAVVLAAGWLCFSKDDWGHRK